MVKLWQSDGKVMVSEVMSCLSFYLTNLLMVFVQIIGNALMLKPLQLEKDMVLCLGRCDLNMPLFTYTTCHYFVQQIRYIKWIKCV